MKYPYVLAAGLFAAAIGDSFAAQFQGGIDEPGRSCLMLSARTRMSNGAEATGTGTSFLVAQDLVLTCNHLTRLPTPHGIVDAKELRIEGRNGKLIRARVVARQTKHDLALLQLSEPIEEIQPLRFADFGLSKRDAVSIIGNFPDTIRTTKGCVIKPDTKDGFAVSNAKVRSGFSGGPVLDSAGKVQGILSQRDEAYNSIFVRSDVVLEVLARYAKRTGRTLPCMPDAERETEELVVPVAEGKSRDTAGKNAMTANYQNGEATR